ncbi:MAG: dolichyl-phosphate-mannose--protein mannosyltransferase [Propionibacterium sp.]|nr:MAG: dolichyl-phosphate-mannose--protein mannosyltransferase [Propionibacterium sp.]
MSDRLVGWIVTVVITAVAFVIRYVNFSYPKNLIFDETYYPKDAYSLLLYGYEREWLDDANETIVAGTPDAMGLGPGFTVHPPLGKWMIAIGEYFFGLNSYGWRFMSVVFGALLVFFTIRLARRISRSTLIGAIAGILITFDGLAFVLSRIGLLDIFQAVFNLAAVSAIVADRDWFRLRLAKYLTDNELADLGGSFGPLLLWRPWRILSGVLFGCAIATKWGSIYGLAVFGVVSVIWDISARRLAGAAKKSFFVVLIDAPVAFISMVVVAAATYLASWSGWLFTEGAWDRQWGTMHPEDPVVKIFGERLGSLWHFHVAVWDWHTGDTIKEATHPYASHPATWPLMYRPVGIDAVNDIPSGTDGCMAPGDTCIRVINAMGTPILWWLAAVALIVGLFYWVSGKDWRFSVPVLGTAAAWLPWFMYAERPIFFFYSIVFLPFTVSGLAMVFGKILGPANEPKRRSGAIAVGVLMVLVIINFAFIYPILTDQLMPRPHWLYRMWFRTWI